MSTDNLIPLATIWYMSHYENTGYDQIDSVVCTGKEQKLSDCSFRNTSVASSLVVTINCEAGEHNNSGIV